jgi:hypothetical protein
VHSTASRAALPPKLCHPLRHAPLSDGAGSHRSPGSTKQSPCTTPYRLSTCASLHFFFLSSATTWSCPARFARESADIPSRVVRSVRAPHASSSCTALVAPAWLAYMSAVAPASSGSVFWMSGSARRCRSSRMHSKQPAAGGALNESSSSPMHAHVRGLAPLCCTRSTLAPARRSAATA